MTEQQQSFSRVTGFGSPDLIHFDSPQTSSETDGNLPDQRWIFQQSLPSCLPPRPGRPRRTSGLCSRTVSLLWCTRRWPETASLSEHTDRSEAGSYDLITADFISWKAKHRQWAEKKTVWLFISPGKVTHFGAKNRALGRSICLERCSCLSKLVWSSCACSN